MYHFDVYVFIGRQKQRPNKQPRLDGQKKNAPTTLNTWLAL